MKDNGSIIELLMGRMEEFCDNYCRFRYDYQGREDELHTRHCNDCPFIKHYTITDKGK